MDQQYLMMRWHSGEARESGVQPYFYRGIIPTLTESDFAYDSRDWVSQMCSFDHLPVFVTVSHWAIHPARKRGAI